MQLKDPVGHKRKIHNSVAYKLVKQSSVTIFSTCKYFSVAEILSHARIVCKIDMDS